MRKDRKKDTEELNDILKEVDKQLKKTQPYSIASWASLGAWLFFILTNHSFPALGCALLAAVFSVKEFINRKYNEEVYAIAIKAIDDTLAHGATRVDELNKQLKESEVDSNESGGNKKCVN